jgi:hypothetical protein
MIMLLRAQRLERRHTQGHVRQLRRRRNNAVSDERLERRSCNMTSLCSASRSKSFGLTWRARSRRRDRQPGRNMKNSSVDVGADADQNLVQSRPIQIR